VPLRRQKEESDHFRIGDLFIVRRGIATGANDFFVVTREHAKALGIPGFSLKPLLPKVKALGTDIVEAESDGYPKVSPQLCIIDCDLSEGAIRKRYPRLMAYLNTAKDLGILKRRLLKDRNPWYKQEHRDPPLFLCTYMGRGSHGKPPLRFIWNRSKAIATNTYLLLYPRPPLAETLSRDPTAASRVFAMLRHAEENGLREHARVHAGGLLKIEPRELLDVRLEVPSNLAVDAINDQLEFSR
jgi:hypothetical protein